METRAKSSKVREEHAVSTSGRAGGQMAPGGRRAGWAGTGRPSPRRPAVLVYFAFSCCYTAVWSMDMLGKDHKWTNKTSKRTSFLNPSYVGAESHCRTHKKAETLSGTTRTMILEAITAAAAAKSLQLCPTLCDPLDGSPPGSPILGILQARTLEWVAISFSNAWKWKVKVKLLSHVRLLATPWTAAYQAPPSMGFSRQEYWSGVPLPSLLEAIDYVQNQLLKTFK